MTVDDPTPNGASGQQRDDVITIILTADNHLGYNAFGQQPRKREERQQQLRLAFQRATDFALGQGVDLFIQAGDLFDTTTPDEHDRTFVAERLAQLKKAGVRTFAIGGVHDTPPDAQSLLGTSIPAPQLGYARLGALHYFPPVQKNKAEEVEPVIIDVHGMLVGICGLGVLPGQEGDTLAQLRVRDDIERAVCSILVLHAPIDGLTSGSSLLDTRALISRETIAKQSTFNYILAGYHHSYSRTRIGQTDVIVAGSSQHVDFSTPDQVPGFVFMAIASDGIRWCNHIPVDSMPLQRLVIHTKSLWPAGGEETEQTPMEIILEELRPLCSSDTMVQLRLEGELSRRQYHQLDLNKLRRYGEEHLFALAIDDSALAIVPEQEADSVGTGERFSPREELVLLADEWIAAASDEQEKKALRATKEELLLALDEARGKK